MSYRMSMRRPKARISMSGNAEREVAVFTEALKIPVQDRSAFLERRCAGDDNLQRKVEALLRAHDRIGSFLEEPPTPSGEAE